MAVSVFPEIPFMSEVGYLAWFYVIWTVFIAILYYYINPFYVPEEYRADTIEIGAMSFVLISVLYNLFTRILSGDYSIVSIIVYLLVIGLFLTAVTGVYYWIPKYFDNKNTQLAVRQYVFSTYTLMLYFMNFIEGEYFKRTIGWTATSTLPDTVIMGGKRR